MAAADYDALSRLKKADYSHYTSAWQSTLAYDVTGISYDKGGNLTALQRYGSNATLLDNLTYTLAATSNRLISLTDVVANSTPAWDAETASLTYDASGHVLTTGAPYHLTSTSYDERQLPITLTANGGVSHFRYDAAGERTYQQVGSSPARYYIRDGARLVGEFMPGGVLDHWNVYGAGLIGRLTSAGVKHSYWSDHLGSIRAVIGTTGSVVEGCDYDVWGVRLEGRCSASMTVAEGFTGKERDGTGLDSFGARYYLSAYGRWGSVDPLSEQHPAWSPYAYVLANPLKLVDPDGRQVEASWLQKYGTAYLWRQAEAGWDRFVMNPAERVNLVRERAKHQVEDAIQYAIEHREAVDRLTEGLDAASVTLTGATLAMAVTGNEPVAAIGAASVRITSAASTGGEFVGFLLAYADRNSTGREITLRAIRIPLTYFGGKIVARVLGPSVFGGKIVARVLGPSVLQEIATALPGLSPEFQKKLAADLVGLIDLSEIVDVKESELEENKDQH